MSSKSTINNNCSEKKSALWSMEHLATPSSSSSSSSSPCLSPLPNSFSQAPVITSSSPSIFSSSSSSPISIKSLVSSSPSPLASSSSSSSISYSVFPSSFPSPLVLPTFPIFFSPNLAPSVKIDQLLSPSLISPSLLPGKLILSSDSPLLNAQKSETSIQTRISENVPLRFQVTMPEETEGTLLLNSPKQPTKTNHFQIKKATKKSQAKKRSLFTREEDDGEDVEDEEQEEEKQQTEEKSKPKKQTTSSPLEASGDASSSSASSLDAPSSPIRKVRKEWTDEEHNLFCRGLEEFGWGKWKKISQNYLQGMRDPRSIASHAYTCVPQHLRQTRRSK